MASELGIVTTDCPRCGRRLRFNVTMPGLARTPAVLGKLELHLDPDDLRRHSVCFAHPDGDGGEPLPRAA